MKQWLTANWVQTLVVAIAAGLIVWGAGIWQSDRTILFQDDIRIDALEQQVAALEKRVNRNDEVVHRVEGKIDAMLLLWNVEPPGSEGGQ